MLATNLMKTYSMFYWAIRLGDGGIVVKIILGWVCAYTGHADCRGIKGQICCRQTVFTHHL